MRTADHLPITPAHSEQNGRLARTDDKHDARFQRAHRLRSSADFARTRQQGRRLNSARLTLIYARRAPMAGATEASGGVAGGESAAVAPTRIGFAISKRVGDAVRRNLVKRRLREHLRRALWKIAPGWDMIIGARPGAAQADDVALGAEALDLLARARLLIATAHQTAHQEEPDRS